jgi:hypothetical protein
MASNRNDPGARPAPPGRDERYPRAPAPTSADSFTAEIEALEQLSLDDIRLAWRERLETEPPNVRAREFLLRLLTWNVQAERYGGLGPETQRRLKRLAKEFANDPDRKLRTPVRLQVGARLVREWRGVSHTVDVVDGGYVWEGKTYKGLSKIARSITKTRWSGPKFFGVHDSPGATKKAVRR